MSFFDRGAVFLHWPGAASLVATFAITMNRYGHMFPSDDHAEAMDKIAATLCAN
jgi:hypothetical protein